ncbi:MAG: hypothetical protein H5U40_15485 [Polyangiaceae bacterium]|nr:hypothetical protein [Polyangiaceae bacterium]
MYGASPPGAPERPRFASQQLAIPSFAPRADAKPSRDSAPPWWVVLVSFFAGAALAAAGAFVAYTLMR